MEVSVFEYAQNKHAGHFRKDGVTPYYFHPHEVSVLVAKVSDDAALFQTALLHDIVEDTDTTLSEIREIFGAKIAYLVGELTIDKDEKERLSLGKKEYILYMMSRMSDDALIVKLSDRLANVKDLKNQSDEEFTNYYLANTLYIMQNLEDRRVEEGRTLLKVHKDLMNEIVTFVGQNGTSEHE